MTEPFKILALDGGGLRGIFTAAVLAEAARVFGPAFLQSVDLIVGTSTGGIIALGLAAGKAPSELLGFYQNAGPRIFGHPRKVAQLWSPKYDRGPLDDVLKREFGESMKMNDLTKPVCISAYELVHGTTRVWKDDHHQDLSFGGEQLVWKVAAATSAAPTYFAPVQLHDMDSHVDGGVWSNNPNLIGITEAVRYFDQQLRDIRLLSIGTTAHPFRIKNHAKAQRMGFVGWARKAVHLLQESSSLAGDYQAKLLLGESNYLRINSEQAEEIKLDDAKQCAPLQEWGHSVGRSSIQKIADLFDLERLPLAKRD
ncbi:MULTISPECIES: CBASS cGAMP-activated phospholipase [Mycobacterium avium complex (MAC)]|nr:MULTISPECIES: CBASS cGAMP-activated phospholipase [Mycobacterium avium complex (MAC)]MCA2247653.1 patatin-like phospholipase family protein [Mycobacterium intracellulare]